MRLIVLHDFGPFKDHMCTWWSKNHILSKEVFVGVNFLEVNKTNYPWMDM